MPEIVDLARARAARRQRSKAEGIAVGGERGGAGLQDCYEWLAPSGARVSMPVELRRWLLAWSETHRLDMDTVQRCACRRAIGLAATLDGVQNHHETNELLAPELLILFWGLEAEPFSLRATWPADRETRELEVLADLFGRPYST